MAGPCKSFAISLTHTFDVHQTILPWIQEAVQVLYPIVSAQGTDFQIEETEIVPQWLFLLPASHTLVFAAPLSQQIVSNVASRNYFLYIRMYLCVYLSLSLSLSMSTYIERER